MIDSVPVAVEPTVESQLIDLGAVPLSVLRRLDGVILDRSLRHVVDKARHLMISADQGGAERID